MADCLSPQQIVSKVYSSIVDLRPPNLNRGGIRKPIRLLQASGLTQKWVRRETSNFDYLMQLNTIAGRTYNDLNQYPIVRSTPPFVSELGCPSVCMRVCLCMCLAGRLSVCGSACLSTSSLCFCGVASLIVSCSPRPPQFPWILSDYTSPELDLEDPRMYRDLSRPMGIQNRSLEEHVVERFEAFDDPTRFHYGSHYSNAAGILHFLIRLEPFTSLHIELQGNK